jgi:two-component system chemotaxis response regulator CheB
MGGLQLLEQLNRDNIKVNVVMVSTLTSNDAEVTVMALERGALDFVTKPNNIIEAKGEHFRNQLLSVLEGVFHTKGSTVPAAPLEQREAPSAAAGTRPVDRYSVSLSLKETRNHTPIKRLTAVNAKNRLVALACSTGGPKALQDVIPYLSKNLDAPLVLVQHMPAGFTKSMAERLDDISKVDVTEAVDGEQLKKGHVYVAPGGKHLEVRKNADGSHKIVLNDMPAIGGLKPCANVMYDSLSDSGYDEIVCVVLTGMGADGTKGILSLCQHKPIHVIAQNAETCVVYGMPRMIAETGIVDEVVPLNEVANTINRKVGDR